MIRFQVIKNKKENNGILSIAQAVLVYAVMMAVFGAFFSVFQIEIKLYQFAIAICDTVIFSSLLFWNSKHIWKKISGVIVLVIIFALVLFEKMYAGVMTYWNAYVKLHNEFYIDSIPIFTVENDLFSRIMVLIFVALAFSIILLLVLKKRKGLVYAILLMVLPVILSAVVGEMPEIFWSLAIIVTGCFYAILYFNDSEKWPVKEWAITSAVLAAVIGISVAVEPLITDYKMNHIDKYYEIKEKIIEHQLDTRSEIGNIGSGSSGGGISEGNLKGITSFNPTGEKMMQIVMDKRPGDTVYLKAFVGAKYTGESWKEISSRELSEVVPIIGVEYERQAILNEPFRRISDREGWRAEQPTHMDMTLMGAARKYGYAPYNANVTSENKVHLDSYIKGTWSKNREYDFYFNYYSISDDEPSELWKEYVEFVGKAYVGEYPELKLLREYLVEIEEGWEDGSWFRNDSWLSYYPQEFDLSYVLNLIFTGSKEYTYNRNPGKMPEGMDFAEGFLLEKKEGFCVHYATTATLLYQMNGVPARYVEGYAVKAEDFKRMVDGTYRAVVTDENAHAWCEVFYDGWQVRDYTPSLEEDTENIVDDVTDDHYQEEPESDNPQGEEPQENPGQEDVNLDTPEDDSYIDPDDDNQSGDEILPGNGEGDLKSGEIWKRVLFKGSMTLAVIFVFWFTVLLQRKVRRKRKVQSFRKLKENRGILKLYSEIYEVCLFAGLKVSNESEKEKVRKMAEMFPQISDEEWNWIYDLAERAAFSGEIFSIEEQKEIYHLYQKLRKNILADLKFGKKIWFLYGKAM